MQAAAEASAIRNWIASSLFTPCDGGSWHREVPQEKKPGSNEPGFKKKSRARTSPA